MNLSDFFEHWQIADNPFQGEEARHDAVFARMARLDGSADAPTRGGTTHSDFEKILGSIERPSTAVVFGEKGSGKTAIRLQIADRVRRNNLTKGDGKVYLVSYDDLNSMLDQLHEHHGGKKPIDSFKKIRLVDHLDAMLASGTTRLVDAVLNEGDAASGREFGTDPGKMLRKADRSTKRDAMLLQVVYDGADNAADRTARFRKTIGLPPPPSAIGWAIGVWAGWVPAVAFAVWAATSQSPDSNGVPTWQLWTLGVLLGLYAIVLAKKFLWDRLLLARLGGKLKHQLRALKRPGSSYAVSTAYLAPLDRSPAVLPITDSDEQRYAMLDKLRRTVKLFGFTGILILIDRLDEPTLVNGEAERMRAIVWPMFNNKFLQQEDVGIKMLLPVELRHALFKESAEFFQEARLDKQHLVERLTWTGAMLYDLCDARLRACRPHADAELTLLDLFAEDVTRQDLIDALDQMHQPRDAFKMLYACLSEHCSNVTREQAEWRIPRLTLDAVRKQESDRVQQLYRGIRPA
ncbi:MAG: hypothetical protein AAF747_03240 [Planctomycetota bacterium]